MDSQVGTWKVGRFDEVKLDLFKVLRDDLKNTWSNDSGILAYDVWMCQGVELKCVEDQKM